MSNSKKPNPLNSFKITRTAEDSNLTSDDFAFVFDMNGNIRCVQMPAFLEDDDILPDDISKMLEYVSAMDLIKPKEVMH